MTSPRRPVLDRFGPLALHEGRRRWTRSRAMRRLTRLEDREVGRAIAALGGRPSAEVAVVIPTYRREHLARDAVASALAQTVDDTVVVVVSDGPEAPSALPDDPRVVSIPLSEHVGVVGVVRNVAIRATDTRVVAFLDDDNTWTADHLATLLEPLDSSAAVAYTAVERVLPDGRTFDRLFEPFERAELRHRNFVDVSSLAVVRDADVVFSRLPRRGGQAPGEDWEFLWRLSRDRHVVGIDHTTVRYLINPGSYFWQGFAESAERELNWRSANPDGAGPG